LFLIIKILNIRLRGHDETPRIGAENALSCSQSPFLKERTIGWLARICTGWRVKVHGLYPQRDGQTLVVWFVVVMAKTA
jgi:hypothetical protein